MAKAATVKTVTPSFSAHITTSGDDSVGTRSANMELVFHGHRHPEDFYCSASGRNQLRTVLDEMFEPFLDERALIRFSDECPDCGQRINPGKSCVNGQCISNRPAEVQEEAS